MTLLNGLLAFGAAAFTIPLLIHLLHRSRYQTIDWGAMHFLQSSRNVNSRRVQWQQLLLLLLRCALPVLLALAMARPLLQSFLSASGPSVMSIAIVIDDSMSMFANDNSNRENAKATPLAVGTRFSAACKSAADILNSLPSGSNATVLFGGSKPETLTGQVPDAIAASLIGHSKRTVPAGGFALEESIRISLEWLAKSQYAHRKIVVISDFQRHEWSDQNSAQVANIAKLIALESIPPELAFINVSTVGEPKETLTQNNLFVASINVSSSLMTIDRDVTLSASLGNAGPTRYDNVQVAVLADETEIDRQEISFAPNSTTLLRTRWSPKRIGDHVLRIQILRDDDLISDNRRELAVIVQEPIPILLVDGDRRGEAMQSETDYLRLALSPFSLLTSEKGDTFISKTIQPNELNDSILKSVRAVCLCNIRELSDVQQAWLRTFVERGNGLIVFLGDKVRSEHYESWPSLANNGLRIAKFQSRTKVTTEHANGDRIKTQQIEFAPIRELSSASLNSLAGVRFDYRSPMTLDPSALLNPSDASIALRFEDDQAWILESKIGDGHCVWVGSACDDDDSNLPTRSIFVPLIQKLVAFVSNANPPTSNAISTTGWSRTIDTLHTERSSVTDTLQVTKPDGTAVVIKLTAEGQLRFSDTRLLGKYMATLFQDETNRSFGPIFACSTTEEPLTRQESELTYLTPAEIDSVAISGKATVSASSKDFLANARTDWQGREIWTWIWIALVVCFLAEIAIVQSLSPRARTKPTATPQQFVRGSTA